MFREILEVCAMALWLVVKTGIALAYFLFLLLNAVF
jgi:hypothetical protein